MHPRRDHDAKAQGHVLSFLSLLTRFYSNLLSPLPASPQLVEKGGCGPNIPKQNTKVGKVERSLWRTRRFGMKGKRIYSGKRRRRTQKLLVFSSLCSLRSVQQRLGPTSRCEWDSEERCFISVLKRILLVVMWTVPCGGIYSLFG